ncbi:MAG: preprotein translocase subunit SecE [Candidatus Omnitrophica bacterium]|nr:preprotein translocase subunit SecE [Candidatus Omnitrophota bacterium]
MNVINNIKKFLGEAKAELVKVSWTPRRDLIGSTAVVISVTAALALYIGMIDIILTKILSLILR